jgi:hypothetical protein
LNYQDHLWYHFYWILFQKTLLLAEAEVRVLVDPPRKLEIVFSADEG